MRGELFEEITVGLREAGCNAVLNFTTGGGGVYKGAQRYGHLTLRPEMASFDCGSMNFGDWVFENSPSFLRELAQAMKRHKVKPEIEIFDVGQIGNALRLIEEGLLATPAHFQFVLGVRGGAPASSEQLLYMRRLLPCSATWSVCALGRSQLPLNVYGLIEGGHVRTGLEDNIYYARGVLAKSNAELVARLVRIAMEIGRPVATPSDTREILGLAE
jgi:3-keto-5-aminohexanoate cleavage enzyme